MNREENLNMNESLSWAANWHKQNFEQKLRQGIGSLKRYPDTELLGLRDALNSLVSEIQQILDQEY
ncbi:MAG: hypothetical protein V7L00_17845 [Nostoc sp.]|uniref:hypothetical protein n=1 Tax=Nostoc sp. TaxID=1180 RepID=UPI002FF48F64